MRSFINPLPALVFTAAIIVAGALSCEANGFPHSTANPIRTQNKQALKFDEYGAVGECDEKARLDNLAIHLLQDPNAKGYIIGYDGRNTLPARRGARHLLALNYLVDSRGLTSKRLVAINGGYREEPATELWIAPMDAPAPEPGNTVIVKKETGKTFKYDEAHPEGAVVLDHEFDYVPEDAATTGNESIEAQTNTTPGQTISIADPPPAPTQETVIDDADETENYGDRWASKEYAQALEEEKGLACVIYYVQREGGHLFELERIVKDGQSLMVRKYGVKEEGIMTIFGGYREFTTIELWIVPPGASLPVPTPDYAQQYVYEQSAGEVKE